MRRTFVTILVAVLAIAGAAPLAAAELSGVAFADRVEVSGKTLVLNGLGLRKKAIFRVYVAGLYLTDKQSAPQAILGADSPRHLVMELVRKVTREQLNGAWEDGLAANTPDASSDVRQAFETLMEWMEDVGNGDRLAFTYVPAEGTTVSLKGKKKGTLPGKAFADALFACWLGPTPASSELKEGLLGN